MKIFILVTFLLTYVLIVVLPKLKTWITGASALIMASAMLIFSETDFVGLFLSVDLNVILMLVGIMLTVGLFTQSKMPNRLADKLISAIPNSLVAITVLVVLAGVISAFIDNVATLLMLAPIGIAVAKKVDVSPIPVIISIAVSSNLQGAATLVGDTTSIMLGGFADMNFLDFFFLNGKPSIFWSVELGALATIPIILLIFRKNNRKLKFEIQPTEVSTLVPTITLVVNILLLIVFSFIPEKPAITNGVICIVIGIITLIYCSIKNKTNPIKTTKETVDFQTIFFLFFLFVIIGMVEKVGIIADISSLFISIGSENVFLLYTVIVFVSVLCSAFIDNIPYVATMLPVISGLCTAMPQVSPYLMYFGLLIGATLGGNLTPVGASANVVGVGILRKEGYEVKNKDFFKIGIPFTLVAVLVGYAFTWLVWA